jgi:hypothetical protein
MFAFAFVIATSLGILVIAALNEWTQMADVARRVSLASAKGAFCFAAVFAILSLTKEKKQNEK